MFMRNRQSPRFVEGSFLVRSISMKRRELVTSCRILLAVVTSWIAKEFGSRACFIFCARFRATRNFEVTSKVALSKNRGVSKSTGSILPEKSISRGSLSYFGDPRFDKNGRDLSERGFRFHFSAALVKVSCTSSTERQLGVSLFCRVLTRRRADFGRAIFDESVEGIASLSKWATVYVSGRRAGLSLRTVEGSSAWSKIGLVEGTGVLGYFWEPSEWDSDAAEMVSGANFFLKEKIVLRLIVFFEAASFWRENVSCLTNDTINDLTEVDLSSFSDDKTIKLSSSEMSGFLEVLFWTGFCLSGPSSLEHRSIIEVSMFLALWGGSSSSSVSSIAPIWTTFAAVHSELKRNQYHRYKSVPFTALRFGTIPICGSD